MADFFAGCALDRLPSARALSTARFVEYAPRSSPPSYATLARLRKQASKWPTLAIVAPREVWLTPRGPLRSGPELDRGVEWLTRAADILSAFAIVIATGAELTTGERDRDLLARFIDRLRPTGRALVIAPRGLWEPEHGEPFARQHGVIYGFDPLEHDAPEGDIVYGRVRPMGARPRLTEGHLAQIAERLTASSAEQAYVSIESEQCVREVKRISRQLSELAAAEDIDDDDEDDEDLEDDDDEDLEAEEAGDDVDAEDEDVDDQAEDEDALERGRRED